MTRPAALVLLALLAVAAYRRMIESQRLSITAANRSSRDRLHVRPDRDVFAQDWDDPAMDDYDRPPYRAAEDPRLAAVRSRMPPAQREVFDRYVGSVEAPPGFDVVEATRPDSEDDYLPSTHPDHQRRRGAL